MGDPITVKRVDAKIQSPMAQLPQDEHFDCNESDWEGSVAGLTTFALRNVASLDSETCEMKDLVGFREIPQWFSLFSVDATPIGGGRTWNAVAAHYNATRVGGNLVCREEDDDDIQDNDDSIEINMGAQRSGNYGIKTDVSIDIDNDWNTDQHAKMTAAMDAVKMSLWSDRLTYYAGAAIPQGFFCALSSNEIAVKHNLGSYVNVVKEVLSEANYGFVKTDQGWMEKMDGVLTLVSALSSENHDPKVFAGVMTFLRFIPGWEEFANVLTAGRAWREAVGPFEQLIVAYNVAKQSGGDMAPVQAEWTKVKGMVDVALVAIKACDENLLNDDQKEVRFMIKNVLLEMKAILDDMAFEPAPVVKKRKPKAKVKEEEGLSLGTFG